MLGAIIGDIVGSRFEFNNYKGKDFEFLTDECFFTDDTILSVALAKTLLETEGRLDKETLVQNFQNYAKRYPNGGYGLRFLNWIESENPAPYGSIGNGSAMRVSAVAWVYPTLEETLQAAKCQAEVTHNSEEGIRGAQAVAHAIYLARVGASKEEIKSEIIKKYYPFEFEDTFSIDNLRDSYSFFATCDKSVPHAIEAFLEGNSFKDVIRTAISLGGDSDTIAAIAGSIAEAYYGIDEDLIKEIKRYLDPFLLKTVEDFETIKIQN